MNWSNMALKGTLGAGSLVPVAILTDALEPYIGIWGIMALVLVPFTILVLVKIGEEIPARYVKLAHAIAVAWYIGLVIATVAFMAIRGFIATDGLLGFFLILGLLPCVAIIRDMARGRYDVDVKVE